MGSKKTNKLFVALTLSSIVSVGLCAWGNIFPRWFDHQGLVDRAKKCFLSADRDVSVGGLEALKDRINATVRWACKEKKIPERERLAGGFGYFSASKLGRIVKEVEELFEDAGSNVSDESLRNAKELLTAAIQYGFNERTTKGRHKTIDGFRRRDLLHDLEDMFLKRASETASGYDLEALRDHVIGEIRFAFERAKTKINSGGFGAFDQVEEVSAGQDVPEYRRVYCSVCLENFYDRQSQPEVVGFEPKFACAGGTLHIFCKTCTDNWIKEKGRSATCPMCRASMIS